MHAPSPRSNTGAVPAPVRTTTGSTPRPDEPSDETLFVAHVAGEPGAFESLFARHAPRIYAMMRRRGLSHADSQDLVQQTFLAAHQARRDFRTDSALLPWLWTIAYNLLRYAYRKQDRAARYAEYDRSGDASHGATPDEERRGVRQAIEQLSPSQREVIVLHWYEGLTFQEIGQVLCASESAVKVRAHRAYQNLRQLLHEPLDSEPRQ